MSEGAPKKILIIDDYPNFVEVLKIRLEKLGYEVSSAYEGPEGLRRAQNDNPDLILLDIMLPKMNGYKVSRCLKFDEKYKDIPIIMLTSRRKESDISLGKTTGADEYLTKPFDNAELIQLIEKYLGKRVKTTNDNEKTGLANNE